MSTTPWVAASRVADPVVRKPRSSIFGSISKGTR